MLKYEKKYHFDQRYKKLHEKVVHAKGLLHILNAIVCVCTVLLIILVLV